MVTWARPGALPKTKGLGWDHHSSSQLQTYGVRDPHTPQEPAGRCQLNTTQQGTAIGHRTAQLQRDMAGGTRGHSARWERPTPGHPTAHIALPRFPAAIESQNLVSSCQSKNEQCLWQTRSNSSAFRLLFYAQLVTFNLVKNSKQIFASVQLQPHTEHWQMQTI